MTTLMITLIGILVAGAMAFVAVSYLNVDRTSAYPDAEVYRQRINNALEIAAQFQTSNGIKPRSLEDLQSISDPNASNLKASNGESGTIEASCSDSNCSTVNICLVLGASEREREAADIAVKKIPEGNGSYASISGSCGNPNASISSNVVITTSI